MCDRICHTYMIYSSHRSAEEPHKSKLEMKLINNMIQYIVVVSLQVCCIVCFVLTFNRPKYIG